MIQVLERAFRMIRRVAEEPERIWSLRELAALSGIRNDSCCHLLRTLCAYGYLESCGKRRGYRLGPEIGALHQSAAGRRTIGKLLLPEFELFSTRFDAPVHLACIGGNERYLLCRAGHSRWGYDYPAIRYDDLLKTATGLVLLAYLPERERAKLLAGIAGENETLPDWESVKARGFLEIVHADNIRKVAFPVHDSNGFVSMSIGCFLPEFRYTPSLRGELIAALGVLVRRTGELLCQMDFPGGKS